MGKVHCDACKKKCSGNALRVQEKYFHVECFQCKICNSSLAQGGFFFKNDHYYCTKDYQKEFGTKCASCNLFVEGEVASALGNTYHQKCFVCARCRQPFPTGEKVTFTGKDCLCSKCVQIPVVTPQHNQGETENDHSYSGSGELCGGCKEELKKGDALIALDKQWHIWCFKCVACATLLHGEYMGKDGKPYCEKDYQKLFGVQCVHCDRFITGKVLQAGENHHFHPTCARCSKCGDPFGDGEEMYLQAGAIWHPRCGPKPHPIEQSHTGHLVGGGSSLDSSFPEEHHLDRSLDAQSLLIPYPSSSLNSSRSASPHGNNHRQYVRSNSPGSYIDRDGYINDLSRVYAYSYLTAEPTQGYLRRPLDPRPPKSPQFHRPPEGLNSRKRVNRTHSNKQGMQVLVDQIQYSTPRPRSPHMNNEEPIEMAHFPGGQKPRASEVPRIERDDFPAPPFPYTDPERRRRLSGNSRDYDMGDMDDGQLLEEDEDEIILTDPQLKKEEEELTKIATGIGKVFLKTVKEREKVRAYHRNNPDPRNASRFPSANKELPCRLRYENPVNASPSRDVDHPKPWEEDELDSGSGLRSSVTRNSYTPVLNHSNNTVTPNYNVVSSLRNVPKPGYGFSTKSATLPPGNAQGFHGGEMCLGKIEKTYSSEFGSGKSDISAISEQDHPLNHSISGGFRSTPYSDGYRSGRWYAPPSPSQSPSYFYGHHFRRSLPNVNLQHINGEPPKMYPYHLLITQNYRLPPEIDRCHLERHLSNEEFTTIFRMSRLQFYRLSEWKRNDMKRRAKLF